MIRPAAGRWPGVIWLLSIAWLCAPLLAGTGDEGDLLRSNKRTWFGVDSFDAALELDFQRSQSSNSSVGGTSKSTENYFQEQLTLHTTGSIYHPNLVQFDLAGGIVFNQDSFSSSGNLAQASSSRTDTIDFTLDSSATLLRNTRLPVYVYAQRSESLNNVDFGPSLREIDSAYGGYVNYTSQKAPMRVDVSHTEQQVIDPSGQQGYIQREDTFQWQGEYHLTERQNVSASYSYTSVTEHADLAAPISFELQNVAVAHGLSFGRENQDNLSSFFGYSNQSGAFPEERIHWTENLTFRNTKTLTSYVNYNYTSDLRPTLNETTQRAEAGFRHKLFESLFTNGAIGANRLEVSDNEITTNYYGRLSFDYSKKVPWGELSSGLGLGYSYGTASNQTQPVPVVDQPVTFIDPVPVIILNTNVIPSSIVVKNAAGVRFFTPNIDYTVITFPTRTEIHRVLGGAIADTQTVLLDYLLAAQPANSTTMESLGYSLTYAIREGWFTGLSVYGRYGVQYERIDTTQPDLFTPDNYNDVTVGMQYQRFGLTLTAEREWHNSTLNPFDSTRFGASYLGQITRDASYSLAANYQIIDYTLDRTQLQYFQTSASLNYRLAAYLSVHGNVVYRNERDQAFGSTRGLEEQVELDYRRRQFTITALVRNVTDEVGSGHDQYQVFAITLRRQF